MADLKDKKMVFIFDECHRSQFGETHNRIKAYFTNIQMFGFTGTPIFSDNANKNELGKRTTKDLFEDCLHKYVITDAIKNRRKISFYYNGPTKPRKDSVKPGRRILVEPTALGLTIKGNLAFKGYVKPPSVTKTGFEKHNWRTFLLNRIHRLEFFDTWCDWNVSWD